MEIKPVRPITPAFIWPRPRQMVFITPKYLPVPDASLTKEIGKGNLIDLKA